MRIDRRVPVVIVAGWTGDADSVASTLLAEKTVVVHHQLRQLGEGVVLRTLRTLNETRTEILELAHGCVSCTLREDLLPLLRKLAARSNVERIILALDQVLEPEAISWAIEYVVVSGVVGQLDGPASRDVRIEAVLTCVDVDSWFDDAAGDDSVSERGLLAGAEDERSVAQVVIGQVEFADALILVGNPDPFESARLQAIFNRLAPRAVTQWVRSIDRAQPRSLLDALPVNARRGEYLDVHAPLLQGLPSLTMELGVGWVEFSADRPFHPERLHEALDVLLSGVLRVRGRLWLATQHDRVFQLESAGEGLRMGDTGQWLDAMTWEERAVECPSRRAMAALRWHPRFGDRDISIVVLVHAADPTEIEQTLRWALVTDEELLDETSWPTWPDPFGSQHEDPCESSESPRVGIERKDQA